MGYDILYRYHERLDDGDYNKEETKELKRKVGDPYEEVSLEKLASAVMCQLARRDIWITNVEIYEYKKQKISFRETKAGIVIKNKKFGLDQDANLVMQEIPEETLQVPAKLPHNALVPHNTTNGSRPIKWVSLDSEGVTMDATGNRMPIMMAIARVGAQLSGGKRYPVYQEMDDPRDKRVDKHGNPSLDRKKVYVILDDQKREVTVSADYFLPADIELFADKQLGFSDRAAANKSIRLSFDGEVNDPVPELRR